MTWLDAIKLSIVWATTTPIMLSHERFVLPDAPLNTCCWPSTTAGNVGGGVNNTVRNMDWNFDGVVNSSDYFNFMGDFFDSINTEHLWGDYDRNGRTEWADYSGFIGDFTKGVTP